MNIKKILGPYIHGVGNLKGRAYIQITYADNSKTTKLYSRYLMEQSLNRILKSSEHVDHIDGNPTNDDINNLQVLTSSEHSKKTARDLHREVEFYHFTCPTCNQKSSKPAHYVRHNKKQGKAGPFCSRSCAGKWSTKKSKGMWPNGRGMGFKTP